MFAVSLIFLQEKWSIPQAWDVQLQESEKQGKYLEKKKKRFIIFKMVEARKKNDLSPTYPFFAAKTEISLSICFNWYSKNFR